MPTEDFQQRLDAALDRNREALDLLARDVGSVSGQQARGDTTEEKTRRLIEVVIGPCSTDRAIAAMESVGEYLDAAEFNDLGPAVSVDFSPSFEPHARLGRSSCCAAAVRVDTADEGTSCHACSNCGHPCDRVEQQEIAESDIERLIDKMLDYSLLAEENVERNRVIACDLIRSMRAAT